MWNKNKTEKMVGGKKGEKGVGERVGEKKKKRRGDED